MSQQTSTTPSVTSTREKVHTNKSVNPINIVRACKVVDGWDGRDYTDYPAILMEIVDEGKQYWFYAEGDEATRDADFAALDSEINKAGGQILFDAVVDAGGNGDYLLPSDAITAGAKTIFIRKGVYMEVVDLNLVSGACLIGESSETVIQFLGNSGIKAVSPTPSTFGGTIGVTGGSATVTGAGTSFAAGDVGKYIRIQNEFYKIATFRSPTSIDLEETYRGDTTPVLTYFIREMVVGVCLEGLVIVGNGTNTQNLILFDGVLNSRLTAIMVRDNGLTTNIKTFESGVLSFINILTRNSGVDGIELEQTYSVNFAGCEGVNNGRNGFEINGGKGITIDNSHANSNNDYGVRTSAPQTIISDSQASQNGEGGIRLFTGALDSKVEGCALLNNEQLGVLLEAGRFVVDSCTIDSHTDNGVRIEANNGVVSNCNVTGCSIGIETRVGGGDNVAIIGNTTSSNTNVGIVANLGDNMVINSNTSTNNSVHGISVLSDNAVVVGNVCFNNIQNGFNILGDNNTISSNRSYGNNKGIVLTATADNNIIVLNNTAGNTTAGVEDLGTGNKIDVVYLNTNQDVAGEKTFTDRTTVKDGTGAGSSPSGFADCFTLTSSNTNAGMSILAPAGGNSNFFFGETGNSNKAAHIQFIGSVNEMRLGAGNVNTTRIFSTKVQFDVPVRFPNMDTTTRDALTGVEKGWTIFNTTTNKGQMYDGTIWNDLF